MSGLLHWSPGVLPCPLCCRWWQRGSWCPPGCLRSRGTPCATWTGYGSSACCPQQRSASSSQRLGKMESSSSWIVPGQPCPISENNQPNIAAFCIPYFRCFSLQNGNFSKTWRKVRSLSPLKITKTYVSEEWKGCTIILIVKIQLKCHNLNSEWLLNTLPISNWFSRPWNVAFRNSRIFKHAYRLQLYVNPCEIS